MTWLAIALAVLAAVAWVPPGRVSSRLTVSARDRPRRDRQGPARTLSLVAGLALPAAGAVVAGPSGAAIGASLAVVTWTVTVLVRKARRRVARAKLRAEVVRGCQVLAAQLRVGLVPAAALATAARDCPALAEPAAEHTVGVAVPVALRHFEARHHAGLGELATAWEVAERAGASLTDTIEALAERLTASRELERLADAELAAPRATGRLLALLPVVGLGLGYLFGGDPIDYLTGSPVGQVCLVAGITLACAGTLWTDRLADSGVP